MRILFAGRPTAGVMNASEIFTVKILFAGGPIACEMGVEVYIISLLSKK